MAHSWYKLILEKKYYGTAIKGRGRKTRALLQEKETGNAMET
jgi:hypothetical protein